MCCASDPLFIIATVPVGAYTPGQMINVDLELTNTSNENVSAFVIQIVRVSRRDRHNGRSIFDLKYELQCRSKIESVHPIEIKTCFFPDFMKYDRNIALFQLNSSNNKKVATFVDKFSQVECSFFSSKAAAA